MKRNEPVGGENLLRFYLWSVKCKKRLSQKKIKVKSHFRKALINKKGYFTRRYHKSGKQVAGAQQRWWWSWISYFDAVMAMKSSTASVLRVVLLLFVFVS